MKKKLSSLYCTFVSCKYFVSDFFIVEKTFAFYEKFLFSEEKTFATFRFTISEGRNFCENGQKSRKFLPMKVSAPKVYFETENIQGTGEPRQSSRGCVLSIKDSSTLPNNCKVNLK